MMSSVRSTLSVSPSVSGTITKVLSSSEKSMYASVGNTLLLPIHPASVNILYTLSLLNDTDISWFIPKSFITLYMLSLILSLLNVSSIL